MQGNLELEIVSGSGVGHEKPVFEALSERSNYRRDYQRTVAGSPICASVVLTRRVRDGMQVILIVGVMWEITVRVL